METPGANISCPMGALQHLRRHTCTQQHMMPFIHLHYHTPYRAPTAGFRLDETNLHGSIPKITLLLELNEIIWLRLSLKFEETSEIKLWGLHSWPGWSLHAGAGSSSGRAWCSWCHWFPRRGGCRCATRCSARQRRRRGRRRCGRWGRRRFWNRRKVSHRGKAWHQWLLAESCHLLHQIWQNFTTFPGSAWFHMVGNGLQQWKEHEQPRSSYSMIQWSMTWHKSCLRSLRKWASRLANVAKLYMYY